MPFPIIFTTKVENATVVEYFENGIYNPPPARGPGSHPVIHAINDNFLDSDGTKLARLCGKYSANTLKNHFYQTSGRKLTIDFNAGSAMVRRGFRLKVRAVPEESTKKVI